MCPVLRKRNMPNVDKEIHVTCASADVAVTYERHGNYVDVTFGYAQVTCFSLSTSRTLRLRTSRHIVPSLGLVSIQSCQRCGITPLVKQRALTSERKTHKTWNVNLEINIFLNFNS